MRKLSPTKAITHALNSVWTYRKVAAHIAFAWLPVLLVCAIAQIYFGPPDPAAQEMTSAALVQIATSLVSLLAISAMSVSWHRFILLDEMGHGLRVNANSLRYFGNYFLLLMAMAVPLLLTIMTLLLLPAAVTFAIPALLLVWGAVTRLSVKLPAIALGNRDFTFRSAWNATSGNFWPCLGVLVLNGMILFGGLLALIVVASGIAQMQPVLGDAFAMLASLVLQITYAFFNASVVTSLYGYFVERREF